MERWKSLDEYFWSSSRGGHRVVGGVRDKSVVSFYTFVEYVKEVTLACESRIMLLST